MWIDNFNKWNEANLHKDLKNELNSLTILQKEEAFYKELTFGTGGIRGIMGVGTNRFNIYTLRKSTLGLALYLHENNLNKVVAISYDNRNMSKEFAKEAAMVLAANNIKSYLFNELRPTPMLSYAVRHYNCGAGIMITASHNPKEYNGYKVYNKTGAQLSLIEAKAVINKINSIENIFDIKVLNNELINYIETDFDDLYLEKIKSIKLNSFDNSQTKIVYSPLHGTGSTVIPKLLKNDNYQLYNYLPHMNVDPNFTNTQSANPEDEKAFIGVTEFALKNDADIIMITDPDADRLGIAVKHKNEYKIINGNQMCAVLLNYKLNNLKNIPSNGVVYKTNVTSNLLTEIANSYNLEVITTLTGFKYIGEQIELNSNKIFLFGCEESLGTLLNDFVRDKDAVQAVYLFAEIVTYLKQKNLTMIDYLETIYAKYGYFLEVTKSITLENREGNTKINEIINYFRTNNIKLLNKNLILIEDNFLKMSKDLLLNKLKEIKLPKENVIKFIFDDNSWFVLRPSGTEPKIKIYYGVKTNTKDESLIKLNELIKEVEQIIKNI